MLGKKEKKKNFNNAKKYMESVRTSIIAQFGKIPGQYEAQLQQLQDLYFCYLCARDEMIEDEDFSVVTTINGGKTLSTNFYISSMIQLTNSIDKIIKNFGLNPLAEKRIKGVASAPETEEDFMNTL
jgi:hypothetical protein